MPFVTQERRDIIAHEELSSLHLPEGIVPGDRCYLIYKEMVRKWKENPCWTTAHEIYKGMIVECPQNLDAIVATSLAWQVFFQWWIVPYEKEAERRNGPIE